MDYILETEITTPLHTVSVTGSYAIVHFMGFDVFGDPQKNMALYGIPQKKIYQHEDCLLTCGWSNIWKR